MGNLFLRDGWRQTIANRRARGVFLLDLMAAGQRFCFSTSMINVMEKQGQHPVRFIPALISASDYAQTIDPYNKNFNQATMSFQIMGAYFPYLWMSSAGQSLLDVTASVYWYIDNCDLSFEQAIPILEGKVTNIEFNEEQNIVSILVEDNSLSGDRLFPPRFVTDDSFDSTIPKSSKGVAYPVIIGSVVALPCPCVTSNGKTFLVMDDPCNKFSTGTPVTAAYDGDDVASLVSSAQGTTTDLESKNYFFLTLDTAPGGDEVNVDVTGNDAGLVEAIVFLLNTYSSKKDFFDLASLRRLAQELSSVTLAMIFNDRVESGVVSAIRERLVKNFPIFIIQRGKKFFFESMRWDMDCVKSLSTKQNILSITSPPQQTSRADLSTEFILRYGVSALRADAQGSIKRNKDNDALCLTAFNKYGDCGTREIDGDDLATVEGAGWLMNWYVQTYTKLRIRVSYRCSMDAVDLNLWDTVQVYDHHNGWTDNLPYFKVVGIHYDESPGFGVDLLSIDNFFDIYNENSGVLEDALALSYVVNR